VECSVSQVDVDGQPASPGRKQHELAKTPMKAQEAKVANMRDVYSKKTKETEDAIVTTFGEI